MRSKLRYKILFLVNSVFAFFLVLAYALPYIPPASFPKLSALALVLPILLGINLGFLFFWILSIKRYLFLPLVVLLMGYGHINGIVRFFNSKSPGETPGTKLEILSYNVRQLNRYQWIEDDSIPHKIAEFIETENADIVSIQEYYSQSDFDLPTYPHRYIQNKTGSSGQAIFSKWPIVNRHNIDFSESNNNAIYADIAINTDTLRVFNLHLESLKIDPEEELDFSQEMNQRLLKKISTAFQKQQAQVFQVVEVAEQSPYKIIYSGDFNNTATSYVYRQLTKNQKDAFKIAGKGFGKTFDLKSIPLRIDMILVDNLLDVIEFTTYKEELSDHYPIKAGIKI